MLGRIDGNYISGDIEFINHYIVNSPKNFKNKRIILFEPCYQIDVSYCLLKGSIRKNSFGLNIDDSVYGKSDKIIHINNKIVTNVKISRV